MIKFMMGEYGLKILGYLTLEQLNTKVQAVAAQYRENDRQSGLSVEINYHSMYRSIAKVELLIPENITEKMETVGLLSWPRD